MSNVVEMETAPQKNFSKKENAVTASFRNFILTSAFQSIISVPHRRVVGYEGLIRPFDKSNSACSVEALFISPKSSAEFLSLDRTCRSLHVKNFSRQQTSNEWLFINLDSQCLALEKPHPGFMDKMFSVNGIKPERVVIEILESEITDRVYLKSLIAHFRSMGCLIAIDDFGAGHSNFDRIWELEPDIVKLDRSLIQRATTSAKLKRALSGIVSLVHGTGSLVIIEGVETEEEALIAIEVNADMLQGFYFSKPKPAIEYDQALDTSLAELIVRQQNRCREQTVQLDQHFSRFRKIYDQAIKLFNASLDFEKSAMQVFSEERAVRCFLLDESGHQVGKSIHSPNYQQQISDRFAPLLSGDKANWSQKHYHYRAIGQPGKLQVTRPYLSVAGLHLCITISKAIKVDGSLIVFCCDLDWQDE